MNSMGLHRRIRSLPSVPSPTAAPNFTRRGDDATRAANSSTTWKPTLWRFAAGSAPPVPRPTPPPPRRPPTGGGGGGEGVFAPLPPLFFPPPLAPPPAPPAPP